MSDLDVLIDSLNGRIACAARAECVYGITRVEAEDMLRRAACYRDAALRMLDVTSPGWREDPHREAVSDLMDGYADAAAGFGVTDHTPLVVELVVAAAYAQVMCADTLVA